MLDPSSIERARTASIEHEISARHIKLRRVGSGGEFVGPCPKCGGTDRFSINTTENVWNCRGCRGDATGDVIGLVRHLDGCSFEEAVSRLAGEPVGKPNGNGAADIGPEPPPHGRGSAGDLGPIVATYDYTDEAGTMLFQVTKRDPKAFRQRRPDGRGGWIDNTDGVRVVLYRLPELLEAIERGQRVWVVEGEKDADRLWSLGYPATTNPRGAGSWRPEFDVHFRGADVVVVGDNDDPGRKHAADVAGRLKSVGARVRLINLAKEWTECPLKGDISDYLDAGLSVESLIPSIWIDMSSWDHEPVPQRLWSILDRVPLNQAGIFSGEGGTGKSIIELMKNVAHVTGKDWLGSMPEIGPAFYIGTEDDENEIHIRLSAIAAHYGVTFKQLIDGGFMVMCLLGKDATLCASSGKSGRVETTELYHKIYEAAGDIKPKNISIDTLSRAFAGNEIDRMQVYGFAMHMQALAKVACGSVTTLSHPSLHGIASGSGISGSTAWHGAFRFRQYLKGVKAEDGEECDTDLRELEFKKNQYGPLGEKIVLRYQRGLFLPEKSLSSIELAQSEFDAEICMLNYLVKDEINVSNNPHSSNYAPRVFARMYDGVSEKQLEVAMRRLLELGKIRVEKYGRPSEPRYRLVTK